MGDNIGRASIYKRPFSSFRNVAFRFYYTSSLAQQGAMNIQMMSRSLLIYRLTGSAAILGILALAQAIPQVCLSIFGGAIADRLPKKHIILAGQSVSVLVTLGIALSLTLGYLSSERAGSWWVLIVASFLQGTIMGLTNPARQAIIPQLVSQEQIMNAVALSSMSMQVLRLIGPAATGFLIDAFDFDVVYYTATIMLLVSVILIAYLPRTSPVTIRSDSVLTDIKEGLKYTWHEIVLLLLLAHSLFTAILIIPYIQLMPIFTEDILKVGASGMGVLTSVSGIGAVVTSIFLASLPNKKRGLMMLVSGVILGVAVTVFSFSTSWPFSLSMMVFVGLGTSVGMIANNSLIQYYADPDYRGRVLSLQTMHLGMSSFGTFAAGILAENIGVQWALGGFAVGYILLGFLMLTFFARLRKLD